MFDLLSLGQGDKKLLGTRALLLGARTLLVAPGISTRNKKLLGTRALLLVTKGITTSSILATRNTKRIPGLSLLSSLGTKPPGLLSRS